MIIKTKYSPNYSKKSRDLKDIKFIIIHYTGMQSKIESIKRLINPRSKVSTHYLIDRNGKVLNLVDDKKIAWHAGKSKWMNYVNLNKNSIGIELVNRGHNIKYEEFTKIQIKNLIKLCLILKKKYNIKRTNILGHSDIAPLRKKDPGEKFPWRKLKKKGLCMWYSDMKIRSLVFSKLNIEKLFFKNLYKIGYRYFNKNQRDKKDVYIIKAFQRRFLPKNVSGVIDQKTLKISHFLIKNNNL